MCYVSLMLSGSKLVKLGVARDVGGLDKAINNRELS